MAETLPDVPRGRFLDGFVAPVRAIRYLLTHPTLMPLAALPLLANMAVLVLLVFFLGPHVSEWVARSAPTEGWKYWAFAIPLKILAWGFALTIGAIFVNLFGTLIASPFNDLLSGKVEQLENRLPAGEHLRTWAQAVGRFGHVLLDEIKKWTVYLAIMACLVPLLLVPFAGHLAFSVLGGLVTFWFLGFEYLDYAFERRHMRFTDRRRFCWSHRSAIIGLGAAVTAATMIPFAGFVVMPLAVVGATLLFLDLRPREADEPKA